MNVEKKSKTPRFFRITATGKWFIFITIALGIAAINTGNNLVYLCLAMNLSLMITSGILSDLATRNVYLKVIPGKEIYAGKKGEILTTIKNEKKLLPLYYLRVILEPAGKKVVKTVPYVGPGRETSAVLEGIFAKRGIYTVRKVSVMTRFPFGFFEKYYHVKADISIIVFPSPSPLSTAEEAALMYSEDSDGSGELVRTGYTGHSLNNIRKFLPKDPVKMVLWKKFMHTKQLYVKELEEEKDPPVILEITPEEDDRIFEHHVARCAGKIVALRNKNIPFVMKLRDMEVSSTRYPVPYLTALGLLSVVEKDGKGRGKLKRVLPLIRQ
jgi:uncharacterized protein (DUF58 family)